MGAPRRAHRPTLSRAARGTLGLALLAFWPTGGTAQPIETDGLGMLSGSAEAPVQVVEFSDFSCPYCQQFHVETFPTLDAEYISTGKVKWVYVSFASGQYANSAAAAAVAECAGEQGHFAEMRERLYTDQQDWKTQGAAEAGQKFLSYAEALGLDPEALVACAESDRIGERIEAGGDLASKVGVRGTPTYVIDGFPVTGALPVDFIKQVLDARLEQLGIGL